MNSETLFEKSLNLVPGGVHSPVRSFKGLHTTPRFIKRSEGAYLYDEDGKNYIDFCMSFGPMILGHKNQAVKEAILEAVENGWSYGACEKYSLELAEFIINKIPFIDQIRFMNSGTEAVMTAVRLARGYTKKNKIIKFSGCYHGHLDSMLIKAGSGLAGTAEASSSGVTPETAKDTLICELGNIEAVEKIFKDHKGEIAGIILEPLPANNGLLIQTDDFLKQLRKICDQNHALLIFDEVISGFRIGFGGMAQKTNINPDIVTYGKIIGGGMPVGAVAGKRDIMQCLAPVGNVYQAGTLSANPVAMKAGLANLKQLTPSFYEELNQTSKNIYNIFQEFFDAHNGFKEFKIKTYDSLFWLVPTTKPIHATSDIPQNLTELFNPFFKHCLERGIYLAPNAYEIGFISGAHVSAISELKKRLWS
jgi:glutamate-1-semialdehyde 2,1-aminomutase